MISEIIIVAIILLFSYIIAKRRGGKTLVPEEPWYRVVPKGEVFQTHKMEFMNGLEKTGQEERFTLPKAEQLKEQGIFGVQSEEAWSPKWQRLHGRLRWRRR